MRKIAVVLSLVMVAFTMTNCGKGCKKSEPETPTLQKNAVENGNALDTQKLGDKPLSDNAQENKASGDKEKVMSEWKLQPDQKLFAVITTNKGVIKAELFWKQVPNTVWNFAALATGKKEWTNRKTGAKEMSPLYSGTIFHRVIKEFMIQGGDPEGTGMGGPGYKFNDEFDPSLRHDKPGILSMANAGPNTNGSQFFITERATPHLDNRHSVFGQVVEGMDVVKNIASVATGPNDKPVEDVKIEKIDIIAG